MIRLPEDNFKHQGMRKKLIDLIKSKGIENEDVLNAMMRVPRHFFLEQAFLNQAYSDHAFQIGAGQTISQPYTVAYQTALLNIKKGDKVLEIGTGSGYQTSVLVELGAKVFSIERKSCYLQWAILQNYFMVMVIKACPDTHHSIKF